MRDGRSYWIDKMPAGSVGRGLGPITYLHVHLDGSEHATDLKTPSGGWISTPGQYNHLLQVTCRFCGVVLQPDDHIEVR